MAEFLLPFTHTSTPLLPPFFSFFPFQTPLNTLDKGLMFCLLTTE